MGKQISYAEQAQKIENKYKGWENDKYRKDSMEREFAELMKHQEEARKAMELDNQTKAGSYLNPEILAKGGWIQSAVKHPGRCTPGSPNYDCPKGSPQWNLAQTFKKHHGFHAYGGEMGCDSCDENVMAYGGTMGKKVLGGPGPDSQFVDINQLDKRFNEITSSDAYNYSGPLSRNFPPYPGQYTEPEPNPLNITEYLNASYGNPEQINTNKVPYRPGYVEHINTPKQPFDYGQYAGLLPALGSAAYIWSRPKNKVDLQRIHPDEVNYRVAAENAGENIRRAYNPYIKEINNSNTSSGRTMALKAQAAAEIARLSGDKSSEFLSKQEAENVGIRNAAKSANASIQHQKKDWRDRDTGQRYTNNLLGIQGIGEAIAGYNKDKRLAKESDNNYLSNLNLLQALDDKGKFEYYTDKDGKIKPRVRKV